MSDVRTFFDMRLAVGRFGWIRGKGSVRPTASEGDTGSAEGRRESAQGDGDALVTAIGRMRARSMYRNCACS